MTSLLPEAETRQAPKHKGLSIALPAVPVVAVNGAQAAILMPDGELKIMTHAQAQMALHKKNVMLCHAPFVRARLKIDDLYAFDVLELFAFVHPAKFCVPTPAGLAKFLGLPTPDSFDDMPMAILESARALLSDLQDESPESESVLSPVSVAEVMGLGGKGWSWTPFILSAFGKNYEPLKVVMAKSALHVWRHLPAWAEQAPPPPPSHYPVTGDETRDRLRDLLARPPHKAEPRPQQVEYATRLTAAFAPVHEQGEPHVVLAEAGTGVGKTLGYLTPASLWTEKNDGTVWISTYTRNLQRQIDQELDRLYPDPDLKARKVAIRKGRENYLCLLNFEDLAAGAALAKTPAPAIAAGIMARWVAATRDGDMSGADFPGWLPGLLGLSNTLGLADRRGECIYAACDHYHKCFVERAIRKSRHASIVVANHALVMIQTALAGPDGDLPQRYVFDEGHHLFDAADGAFSSALTAWETVDMRRWILGPEGGKRSRARGIKRRVDDLIEGDGAAAELVDAIVQGAHILPSFGWSHRLKDRNPQGATEEFLALVYQQVYARSGGDGHGYSLETDTRPLIDGLSQAASILKTKLRVLQKPMLALAARLKKRLEDHADTLDSDTRRHLDAVSAGLIRRGEMAIGAWVAMLDTLDEPHHLPPPALAGGGIKGGGPVSFIKPRPSPSNSPSRKQEGEDRQYIDWMEIIRSDGQASDVGLYRHYVDPMQAFATAIRAHAQGIAITSATLRDNTGDDDDDWRAAMDRTGGAYLSASPQRLSVPSPFDYAARTRAFVITDVRKDDMAQVASAYRTLFEAAGGGGLGLFTAISRLRAVHDRIHAPLEEAGIPLYAQHVDGIDTGTLVDIFRDERHACLLGTDAVRDGIDVPGDALRLLVYDRVPWPRPTILHKARREEFGLKRYDDMTTRLRLRQAFGRLIRRADDKGVFVMLDSMLPSRLYGAFPDGVIVERVGLAEAAGQIKIFLQPEQ